MKKHNPSTPIMVREAAGTLPKVYARYEFGQEKSQSLEGMCDSPSEEARHLQYMLTRLNEIITYRPV